MKSHVQFYSNTQVTLYNFRGSSTLRKFSIMLYVTYVCLLVCFIFILLSRESAGGAIYRTNPHPLRSWPFPSFPVVSLTSYHLTAACSKLPSSHQPPTTTNHRQRLIQGRNNVYDEGGS